MNTDARALPSHVVESVRALAELQAEQERDMSGLQRTSQALTVALAAPRAVLVVALIAAVWMLANAGLHAAGARVLDPWPFSGLGTAVSLAAFLTTMLILATQRREDILDAQRAQLTLQIALLNEQKTAKMIEILEHIRITSPYTTSAADPAAEEMARPVDPEAVHREVQAAAEHARDDAR
jgi:uncharacterized membrane protein